MGCGILGSLFVRSQRVEALQASSEPRKLELFRDAAPRLQGRVRRAPLDNGLRAHATACIPPFTSQLGACARPRTPPSASARRLDWGSGARCGVCDRFDSSSTRG